VTAWLWLLIEYQEEPRKRGFFTPAAYEASDNIQRNGEIVG
jgi:hypothetical protein